MDRLTQIEQLRLHVDNDLWPPCLDSLLDEVATLEARIAKADALAEASKECCDLYRDVEHYNLSEALAAYREGSDT